MHPAMLLPALALALALVSPATLAQARPPHPPAHAAPRPGGGPKSLGKFEDWQAATHMEGGQQVCYAFTRVQSSQPTLPGRGDVVMTVTQRPTARDAVAITAGYSLPTNSDLLLAVNQTELPFYTSGRSAFARDGKATVAAFAGGRQAVAKAPAPRGASVTDTFSLRGFSAAYAAINRVCPAK